MSITKKQLKDPQQKRVYIWEAEHVERFDKILLSNDEVKEIILKTSVYLNLNKPKIKIKKSDANCRAYPLDNTIVITQWGKTATTVLHELAHIADYQLTKGHSGMGHGPAFLSIAIALYSKFLGIEKKYLMQTASGMGLSCFDLSLEYEDKSSFFEEEF
jgi:hypothetical protein